MDVPTLCTHLSIMYPIPFLVSYMYILVYEVYTYSMYTFCLIGDAIILDKTAEFCRQLGDTDG